MSNKDETAILREVMMGFLPLKKNERSFGFWDLLLIQVGVGISCFGLLVGGYTGLVLDAKDSMAAILFGNALPVLLTIPIAILFTRYGVDTFVGFRSALGYRGSNILFALFTILNLGFITIACFMVGQSVIKLLSLFQFSEFWTARETGAPLFAIIGFILALIIAHKGPVGIKWLNWIGIPAIFLVLMGLIVVLFIHQGMDKVFALKPSAAYPSDVRSFATAIEFNIGLGFSWLVYIGQYSRLAKSEKGAFASGFWSYGFFVNAAAILGALCTLVVASQDPPDWMANIGGGVIWTLIGLVLLIVGNITAAVFLIYSQAVSFKTVFPKQKWMVAVATTIPAIILMISPSFYDAYSKFLSVVSYTMAVMGGIVISDFFFVKKQRVSLRDLYNLNGAYRYWNGVNPSAIISLIVGTIVYWSLYNPLTDHAHDLFQYMTGGLPTYFVSAICYYVCSKYLFAYPVDRPDLAEKALHLEKKLS